MNKVIKFLVIPIILSGTSLYANSINNIVSNRNNSKLNKCFIDEYAKFDIQEGYTLTVLENCTLKIQRDGKLNNRGTLKLQSGAELISPLINMENDFKRTRNSKKTIKHGRDNEGGIIEVGRTNKIYWQEKENGDRLPTTIYKVTIDFSKLFDGSGIYAPKDNFIMNLEGVKIKLFDPNSTNITENTLKNITLGNDCVLDYENSNKISKDTLINMFKNGNKLKINPEYFAGEETNMDRVKYNANDLLNDIPNIQNGIGEDLTYTDIYDNIKKARFEEDNVLSQGVWKHELQVPDWKLVEKLSVDAIQNKSKDLQIIGWLIESLVMLDKFEGISNSINILNSFINKYWETCYPLLEDKTSNTDQKLRILEWIYETVYRRSNLINLFGDNSFSIYNYEYALEINSNIIRNPKNKYQIIESANKNNIKFLEDINNIINSIDQNEIEKLNSNINNIKNNIRILRNTLKEKTNNDRSFTKLLNNIDKIEKLLSKRKVNNSINPSENEENVIDKTIEENISSNENNTNVINNKKQENENNIKIDYDSESDAIEESIMYDKKQENENNNINKNSNNEMNIKIENQYMSNNNIEDKNNNKSMQNNINKSLSREEIYNSLSELYLQLKEIDKHSPSPYLLNLILEWKDKTLLEIITDAKTGNTESHQLLRKLIS